VALCSIAMRRNLHPVAASNDPLHDHPKSFDLAKSNLRYDDQ
jgi:hypothetical protein